MEKIEFTNDEFSCTMENGVAVLTVKGNAFSSVSKLERNHDIIPWLNSVEKSNDVRGVLVTNEKDSMSEDAYVEFLKNIVGDEFNHQKPKEISRFTKNEIRAREINIMGNLIRTLSNFDKIVVNGIHGDIVSPFFGLALAADFRFASSTSNFVLSHIKYRLHPSGALPFFLPLYLGRAKVLDVLFRQTKIPALELKELGLVTNVFDASEFREKAIAQTIDICKISLNVVHSTKRLLYAYRKDLEAYLDIEADFTLR